MLKIGEFSKLSFLTIKALRFYEEKGLLKPAKIDKETGYRLYDSSQLIAAARIKAYRQLGFGIDEIALLLESDNPKEHLIRKQTELQKEKRDIDTRLLILKHILEDKEMKYQVVAKTMPEQIVYYTELEVKDYSEMMEIIPSLGEECLKLNPEIKCSVPQYEFCEYLDGEYKEKDIRIRHSEAVDRMGKESERIKFKILPETKLLCVFHKGGYESIGEAYAFIYKYAKENGYETTGLARESYIDGIWNKESKDEWLTELQLPIR